MFMYQFFLGVSEWILNHYKKNPIKSLKFGKDGMEWTWSKVVYLKDANSINAIKKPKSSNWIELNGIVTLMDIQTIASFDSSFIQSWLIKIRFVHYPQFDRTKSILSFEILTFFQNTHKKLLNLRKQSRFLWNCHITCATYVE